MASKAPLAFTLEGVPLLTTPEVNAYVAKLNATTKDKIDRGRVMGAWSAQSMIRRRLTDFAGGTLCQHCWLSQIYCVCRSLPPVLGPAYAGSSGECTLLKNRMRVSVVLHPKEFLRSSNTGRFLNYVLPKDTRVLVWEPSGDDFSAYEVVSSQLRDVTNEPTLPMARVPDLAVWSDDTFRPEVTVLLYPSADSIPAREFISSLRGLKRRRVDEEAEEEEDAAAAAGGTPAPAKPCFHLIVVDGTWTQAKKMAKVLAARVRQCLRIDVPDFKGTLYTPLRKETVEGRTSTLEAIAAALSDLGESSLLTSRMLRCVRVLTDGLLRQTGREFRCVVPPQVLLPLPTGTLSSLPVSFFHSVLAYLDNFPRSAPDTGAAAGAGAAEEDDEEEDASDASEGLRVTDVGWRSAPRLPLPLHVRALMCTNRTVHTLVHRYAIAVLQKWRA